MRKQSKLTDMADKYMQAATKRFTKKRFRAEVGEDEFINGFTWGAHAGFIAGFHAALKNRVSDSAEGAK